VHPRYSAPGFEAEFSACLDLTGRLSFVQGEVDDALQVEHGVKNNLSPGENQKR